MSLRTIAVIPVSTIDGADRSVSTTHERRQVSSFTVEALRRQIDGRQRPRRPATELYDAYRDGCWVAGNMARARFEDDPVAWVDESLDSFAHQYPAGLADLGRASQSAAADAAGQLMNLFAGTTIASHMYVPLGGLTVASPLSTDGITIRPLTPEELGDLYESDLRAHFSRPRAFTSETVSLEVVVHRPKTEQRLITSEPHRLILALQLLGFNPCGTGMLRQRDFPIGRGTLGQPMVLPSYTPNPRACTQSDLKQAADLAARIPSGAIDQPNEPYEVALHRFRQGCADSSADSILDFAIALEAVLLPRDSAGDIRFQGELRFRFGLHGARFLGPGAPAVERGIIQSDLLSIYDRRSAIVHGGPAVVSEIPEVRAKARRLAEDALKRGLMQGWPNAAAFRGMVLE